MPEANPKRRWFQFSLRILLAFTLLVALGCGWFAVKLRQAARQKAAVAAILALRGHTWYDISDQSEPIQINSHGQPVRSRKIQAPGWLIKLLGPDFFRTVVGVDFVGNQKHITDADLL